MSTFEEIMTQKMKDAEGPTVIETQQMSLSLSPELMKSLSEDGEADA